MTLRVDFWKRLGQAGIVSVIMVPGIRLLLVAALLQGCTSPPAEERIDPFNSILWGRSGELWHPTSPLPDFSFAGYHAGEQPTPRVPVAVNVKDFGALGDGVSDDSQAFLRALAAVDKGTVYVPPGRYRLTEILSLEKSGVVLRGAGPRKTTLFFPIPLYEKHGKSTHGGPTGWSWGGGWIWVRGGFEDAEPLCQILEPAMRGESALTVSDPTTLAPGQMIRIVQYESDGSLTLHIHAGQPLNGRCHVDRPGFRIVDWAVEIVRIEGHRVYFDRPLRTDVRLEWQPAILPFVPRIDEVGVESLTVEFPVTPQAPHHRDLGYNGIFLDHAYNSWVQNVEVVNSDNGVLFTGSRYSTGRNIVIKGRPGHYGLGLRGTQDCLMTDFVLRNTCIHDLSFANLGTGSVFSRGRGRSLNFDHHRNAAYENLFSDLYVGRSWRSRRIWACSPVKTGHYTAARETFWNIRPCIQAERLPYWPAMNVIGPMWEPLGGVPLTRDLGGWFEPVETLEPADLHAAQLARRLRLEGSYQP